ncbi:coiled-coil domain-containing protein 68 [Calypte anna]|uniref:coiled-coil domain-containing protein 68 n=1 Tax=Calypte anna TaxID=9244 RepID=UPI0011C401F0|nr:coiled-coil domain-containing protein 68 [Calypte anna]
MAAVPKEQRTPRIVVTTLLLTKQLTREDHGPEGNFVLYGSSSSQITEEAEYVQKLPQLSGSQSRDWSHSPVVRTLKETEEQLLLVSKENQVLRIKLEALREAGAQVLRSSSQKLAENYQTKSEGLKKSHEHEKQQIQVFRLQQEKKLQESRETTNHLAESLQEKSSCIQEMEDRLQRMQEEKKTLLERKKSFEERLQQMMAREEDGRGCLDLQGQIATLQEQISHLQHLIQRQHHGLRGIIQEAEVLKNKLKSQDARIEKLTEKLSTLETQNQELKEQLEFWSGQPKTQVSKAVWTDTPRVFGAPSSLLLPRIRRQES